MSSHPNRSKRAPKPGAKPTPQQIIDRRQQAGLTQSEAATLVYASLRAWQQWESSTPGDARGMHPAMFELFELKTAPIIRRLERAAAKLAA